MLVLQNDHNHHHEKPKQRKSKVNKNNNQRMSQDEDEDPFGVFSDDDEDEVEEVTVEENKAARMARSLVEKANQRLAMGSNSTTETDQSAISDGADGSTNTTNMNQMISDKANLKSLELKWPSPLYLGPMKLVSGLICGGGRGYVASERLNAGTLVLVEEIAMKWPPEQLGNKLGLVSVRHLLSNPQASKLIHDMEDFHPTKDVVDNASNCQHNAEQVSVMIDSLRQQHTKNELDELVKLADKNKILCRNSSRLNSTDILRLYLCLRYNGLESGVYRHVAMLNHSCHPNCAKLLPSSQKSYSEVRTTRPVAAGESLTISYLPRVMSHASRRRHLWDQHRFDIGIQTLPGDHMKMEFVGTALPPSTVLPPHESNPCQRIEAATEELEKLYHESAKDIADGTAPPDIWETVKALEVSALELYTESANQLKNDSHIILIPCLSLHLESCQLVQQAPSLSRSTQVKILSRLVVTARKLLTLQEAYLGPDHFDLARTNLDFAQAIGELLSRSPKQLFDLNLPSLKTFDSWSAVEQQSRREYKRIKALYPHDAEEHINRATKI